ncbi:helix-turn-helix domain-containing protein [Anaerotruncus colihominis]
MKSGASGRAVGFNDTSYFNRIFKKVTGYTPKEFIEYNHSVL